MRVAQIKAHIEAWQRDEAARSDNRPIIRVAINHSIVTIESHDRPM
jgi:hypothetical protein